MTFDSGGDWDTLSRDEKVTQREQADELVTYLQSNGGTAPPEDCKKALDYPKVNWARIRAKAGVQSVVNSGGGGKGGSSALWTLGSKNTSTAIQTVTLCNSEGTYTNIEPISTVFSGTSPRIPAREYIREYNKGTEVLSESVPSEKSPKSLPACPNLPEVWQLRVYKGECQTCAKS